jgi:phage terminase large subunit-like protein
LAEHAICAGQNVGIFAPDYKILAETFNELAHDLSPLKVASSKIEGVFRAATGGRADFWSLDNERAGRSRKYHLVIIDEAAFAKPNMLDIWERAIKPSLLDYVGGALVLSTPNGSDPENFFYRICTEPKFGFTEYHAPTAMNPYLPPSEIARLEAENHPLVYRQEYLAEFVDWSGAAFFSEDSLLEDGHPVPCPDRCDTVFAIIDTAVKDTLEHDGTAVIYCAKNKRSKAPLTILDWDVLQIKGNLLNAWLPNVYTRLEELSAQTRARYGVAGAWIEDKVTGTVLIQHAESQGFNAHAIDSKLTALGKDPRALSASPYVYRGEVKISQAAYNKHVTYRGQSRNHLLSQVCGYRMGAKTAHNMDLLDCFTYSVMIALGNSDGY